MSVFVFAGGSYHADLFTLWFLALSSAYSLVFFLFFSQPFSHGMFSVCGELQTEADIPNAEEQQVNKLKFLIFGSAVVSTAARNQAETRHRHSTLHVQTFLPAGDTRETDFSHLTPTALCYFMTLVCELLCVDFTQSTPTYQMKLWQTDTSCHLQIQTFVF